MTSGPVSAIRYAVQSRELDFQFPDRLIATERKPASRVMLNERGVSTELAGIPALLERLNKGDCLVVNDTRVLRRRVFTESELEILFLAPVNTDRRAWRVLCPSSRWKEGAVQTLPEGVGLRLTERGRTQVVEADRALDDSYFERVGEMPLPPYIQKARGERHHRSSDPLDYQTGWARNDGSLAAPTASLHFSADDLARLELRGVSVARVTLHVGLGTFLPVTVEELDEHVMHGEVAIVTPEAWASIQAARKDGGRVWALGTTVTRTLESVALGKLSGSGLAGFAGETDLFIRPGYEWQVVDALLTNFHQPRSTLLALVAAFAGLENVKRAYAWAIEREFRLFSYGDLSAWIR